MASLGPCGGARRRAREKVRAVPLPPLPQRSGRSQTRMGIGKLQPIPSFNTYENGRGMFNRHYRPYRLRKLF